MTSGVGTYVQCDAIIEDGDECSAAFIEHGTLEEVAAMAVAEGWHVSDSDDYALCPFHNTDDSNYDW